MSDQPRPGESVPSDDHERDGGAVVASAPPHSTQAIVAFVLGIFSVVGLWVLGPVAIVVANGALRKVDAGEIPAGSRGLAVVGRILGIIATVLLGLGVLALVGGIVFVVSGRATTTP